MLTEVLPSHWSDTYKGDFGLINTVCSVVGGLFGGVVTDLKPLQKRLKSITAVSLVLAAALFVRHTCGYLSDCTFLFSKAYPNGHPVFLIVCFLFSKICV